MTTVQFTIQSRRNLFRFLVCLLVHVRVATADCVPEFGTCVVNRDCRGDKHLKCVTGDWAVTTDSTCLSARSQVLDAWSREDQLQLLHQAYQHHSQVPPKSLEEIDQIYQKHARPFSKLVVRLERKYGIVLTDDNEKWQGNEL